MIGGIRNSPKASRRLRGPRRQRAVFTIDLTSADGLFSAREFRINPNDQVMATESPVDQVIAVSNIAGNFVGLFNATQNLSN